MKVTPIQIVFSLLVMSQLLTLNSSSKTAIPAGPIIKVDCSLDSNQQTVEFKWRATNATYVLINGRDARRYEVEGKFIDQRGGAYTFVAIGQNNKNAREPKACYRQDAGGAVGGGAPTHGEAAGPVGGGARTGDKAAGAGGGRGVGLGSPQLVEYFMYVPGLPISGDKILTTTMSKPQIEQQLTDLFKSELDVPTATRSPDLDSRIFVYTADYTDSARVCRTTQCNPGDNVKRRVGFNVLLTKIAQESDKSRYRISVFADVLFQPADKSDVWLPDPASQEIGKIIATALAERLSTSMPK